MPPRGPASQNPLHVETLADLEVEYRACLVATLNAALLQGVTDGQAGASAGSKGAAGASLPTVGEAEVLLRLLTPLCKLYTGKQAVRVGTCARASKKGKGRKGKERKGKERKGKERKGKGR